MEKLTTYKPAIVIPAHKRRNSLLRLLQSVNEAGYTDDDIHLIISIDGGGDPDVIAAARDFQFEWGTVEVIEHKEQLGLYRHILQCADLSQEYGSVLILEDDLTVSPAFYQYACKALSFYDKDDSIGGISLYSQRFNETAQLPFEPLETQWPVYFMQLACSWGQAWTYKQWADFKQWHSENGPERSLNKPEIPPDIQKWPASSWKKYFHHYLIERDKYIVYPYRSFSTNGSEGIGVHMKYVHNTFQVPLYMSDKLKNGFQLPSFNDDAVMKYDSFMESRSSRIEKWTGVSVHEIEMDLYGTKPPELLRSKIYTVTSKTGGNPIRSFPLSFRPVELNLKFKAEPDGDSFFNLYKTEELATENGIRDSDYFRLADYFSYFPIQSRRFAAIYFKELFRSFIKRMKQV